jgi:formate dehydrogenase iron-sulfur subunit
MGGSRSSRPIAFRPARPRRRRLPDRHQVEDRRRGAEGGIALKYIVCNADEGDSGTFADRMLMEGRSLHLIEGHGDRRPSPVGATEGLCLHAAPNIRMPCALRLIEPRRSPLRARRAARVLGGPRKGFDMEVRIGAGAYVCGEETALLESLEGKRGQVRAKPPLPAHAGLFGRPTVVNNVLSLASVPADPGRGRGVPMPRLRHGPLARHDADPARRQHVKPRRPVRARLRHDAAARWSTRSAAAREAGGRCARCRSAGRWAPISRAPLFDTPFDYEAFAAAADRPCRHRGVRRHGRHGAPGALRHGILRHRNLRQVHALPHRLDARRETIDRRSRGEEPRANLELVDRSLQTMKTARSAPWAASRPIR